MQWLDGGAGDPIGPKVAALRPTIVSAASVFLGEQDRIGCAVRNIGQTCLALRIFQLTVRPNNGKNLHVARIATCAPELALIVGYLSVGTRTRVRRAHKDLDRLGEDIIIPCESRRGRKEVILLEKRQQMEECVAIRGAPREVAQSG